ncbi:MAG TPA: response regulator [Acidobacteriota bacterium]|nr:response regulator [Acidobacteriota bacterium]
MCFFLKKALTPEGYDVFTVLDGVDGLKIVNEKEPDIVLLDLKMPKMDRIEVLQHISNLMEFRKNHHEQKNQFPMVCHEKLYYRWR